MMLNRSTRSARFAAVVAVILACMSPALAQGDFIRQQGTRLVDSRGERFDIKSINLGNWLVPEGYMVQFKRAKSPREIAAVVEALVGAESAARFWETFRDSYVTEDDIRFIKAAGFNTVRVPLHYNLFATRGEGGVDRFEGPGWRLIDRLLGWARNAGLRVIVDMHAAPGGQTGVNHDDGVGFPLTFYVPRHKRLTVALWREIALRYRDEPTLIGYDLLNEPISPYSDERYLNPMLEPFYREITEAIRGVNKNHVVMLAGGQWSSSFAMFSRPFDSNVVYTYHQFWADPTRKSIQRFIDFGNRWQVPLLIGETGEASDDWNDKYRRLHERFGIGWSFWAYKNMDSRSTVVSVTKPEGWDLIGNISVADIKPGWQSPVPRERAQAMLDQYLENIRLKNGRINAGYLESLGLRAP